MQRSIFRRWSKVSHRPFTLCWTLCLSIGLGWGMALPLRASEPTQAARLPKSMAQTLPTPPNLGVPKGRTGGGASRGSCAQYQTMQSIGQANRPQGLTTQERPTLWFYVPERTSAETSLEFVLQDAEDRYIYQTVFNPPTVAGGLISMPIPPQSPALVPGVSYQWTLSVQCNPARPNQVAFIRGRILREIAPTLSLSHPGDAQRYTEQGYLDDALTLVVETMKSQPENPLMYQLWHRLLEQAGLNKTLLPAIAAKRSQTHWIGNTAQSF